MISNMVDILKLIKLWKEFGNISIGPHVTDAGNWCRSCKICVAKKGLSEKGKSPLQIYNSSVLFERVQMDKLGPLPSIMSGNRYLLVVIDCFTKLIEALLQKNIGTKTVAKTFVNEIVP